MSTDTVPAKYASVNGAWPEELPPISDQEAIVLARRLFRKFMGRKAPTVKITSGNRDTWVRRGVLYVNPQRRNTVLDGWRDIVHHLSHYVHRRKNPGHKPHDGRGTHAFIEREMIAYVVKSGYLEGKLKREPKPRPTREEIAAGKLVRLDERIKRWQTKQRRAETALTKLTRRRSRIGARRRLANSG